MPENDNEKKYEFITEEIVNKKKGRVKKALMRFMGIILSAILFGIIVAVTFICVEPKLYNFYLKNNREHIKFEDDGEKYDKDKDDKTPEEIEKPDGLEDGEKDKNEIKEPPVYIESKIDANVEDYINIYKELQKVSKEANKSIVRVSGTIKSRDIFENEVESIIETSGLVIAQTYHEMYILVSYDRIEKANNIRVTLVGGEFSDAVLHDYDTDFNLGVLLVRKSNLPVTALDEVETAKLGESYSINVGDPVIALGNPNGYLYSVAMGFVTSKDSSVELTDNQISLFNTDIKDNKNSDGIIINGKGEVIGIITNSLKKDLNQDINTVIGISKVKNIIESLVNKTPRLYFGAKASDIDEKTLNNYEIENGIYVNEVEANSPAFVAGVKSGDIIVSVDGQVVTSSSNFNSIISKYQPGAEIEVNIMRTSVATEKDIVIKANLVEKAK